MLNLDYLTRLDAYGSSSQKRHDEVGLSIFVARELEQVIPQMFDRLFPELDARLHIPMGTGINPAAPVWSYDSMDKRGNAKIIGANVNDIPRADVSKRRVTHPVRTIALAYGWSFEEIATARWAGVPLDTMKAEATRRGLAQLEHDLLISGDIGSDIPGFLTDPRLRSKTVTTGAWLGGVTTPDEIIFDVCEIVNAVKDGSENVHMTTAVLFPRLHMDHLRCTRLTDTGRSLIEYLQGTHPGVEFLEMNQNELASAGPGGAPRMLAYQKDPGILTGVVPESFRVHAPQERDLEVVINAQSRVGGTAWYYPAAACFGDGI